MSATEKQGRIKAVKSMFDLLPPESERVQALLNTAVDIFRRYGFGQIATPIVEYTPLFSRSIGDATDIVEKEMYTFDDRDGRSLALRPEGTAGAVRSYVEHAVSKREPVTRWFYSGPMFRHERAQRGRYRQFRQIGAEIFGVQGPAADAELLMMLWDFFTELGLDGLELHLNSIGCDTCRPVHRKALVDYLTPQKEKLCEDCERRHRDNPLRVLDCKKEGCKALSEDAPKTLEYLCGDCSEHWAGLMTDLGCYGLPHSVNHRLVRGLDYYNRTTFELICTGGLLGSQNTIAGGGRYDGLVEQLGGGPIPAVGFAMGVERVLLALPPDKPEIPTICDVFIVVRGEDARLAGLSIAQALRKHGLAVHSDQRGTSVKSQMKRADRLAAKVAIILGDREIAENVATLRRLTDSQQQDVSRDSLEETVLREFRD